MKRVFLFSLLVVALVVVLLFALNKSSLSQGLVKRNTNTSSYSSDSFETPNDGVKSALNQATDLQIKYDVQTLESALINYYSDRNEYPNTLDVLLQLNYVPEVPMNPITKSNYQYVSDGQSFSLTAITSDGSSVNISR